MSILLLFPNGNKKRKIRVILQFLLPNGNNAVKYVANPNAEALAYSLPVRSEPYAEKAITPFFSNLLPDESVQLSDTSA